MEDIFAMLCAMATLGLITGLPVAALFTVGRLMFDVRTLRQRIVVLEDAVDALQLAPRAVPAPAAAIAPVEVVEAPAADVPRVEEGAEEVPEELPVAEEAPEPPPTPVPARAARAPSQPWQPPSPERIAVLLGAGIGGLALLIGVVLGLVAVMESGLVGPAARVSGGLVLGTVLWVTGALLRGRLVAVPSALAGAGMGVLYGALFAAHGFYGLIGTTPTFLLLVLVSGVAGLRATAMHDRFMAYLGLFGGFLAPLAVSTGQNGAVGLFTFLLLLSIAVLGAAGRRRWPDLVVACLAGTAALYAGWTATWLAPDSVRVALVSAFVLAVPYALVAARLGGERGIDRATRLAAGLGAVAFVPLAFPWLLPLDVHFLDPRSGLRVVQSTGSMRDLGLVATALLPLPAWLASRARASALTSALTTVLALGGLLTWLTGWAAVLEGPDTLLLYAPFAPLAIGLLAHLGARRTGMGLGLLLFGWMIAFIAGATAGLDPALLGGSVVLLTVLGVLSTATSTTAPMLLALLGATAAGLLVQAGLPELTQPYWLAGCILLLLGAVPFVSLRSDWKLDPFPALGWMPGTLAGVALFPAAYVAWDVVLGSSVIGLLPLLLGFHALLVTAVLIRAHGLRLEHPAVVVSVILVLAGVTFALPIQVQEKWLTVGWAMEGLALAWIGLRVRHPLARWGSVLLGVTVAVRLLANPWALEYGSTAGWPVLNWTLYTWGVPTLCLVGSAMGLERTRPEQNDGLDWAPQALRILAMLTGFALVNVEVSHAFQDTGPVELGGTTMLQGMVRSLAWGGWGLALLVVGLVSRSRVTRFVGFAFLLLAAAKVFVYDLWAMPGFVRVGSLVGLGVTLLVSAVLFNRLVLREPTSDGET